MSQITLGSTAEEIEKYVKGLDAMGKPIRAGQGIGYGYVRDPFIVVTAQLSPVLDRVVAEFESDRPADNSHMFYGPVAWISKETGINPRRILGIRKKQFFYVSLKQADRILTPLHMNYMLTNGEITPVRNPAWSQKRWERWEREHEQLAA